MDTENLELTLLLVRDVILALLLPLGIVGLMAGGAVAVIKDKNNRFRQSRRTGPPADSLQGEICRDNPHPR